MAARGVLGIVFAFALCACGGSSSETPPPLQPDPAGFHYAGVSAAASAPLDAGVEPTRHHANEEDDDDEPRTPARSTWGTPSPRR
ncbi:MAG TPA: hypothetical protein VHV51_17490 [Polyangiaceae bacterium]|nr:hypothetical protein [Polyangiaceae bacterium]